MNQITRRDFLRGGSLSLAALMAGGLLGSSPRVMGQSPYRHLVDPKRKVRVAAVGVGGRGRSNLRHLVRMPNVELTVFCDVDLIRARPSFNLYPNLPRYKDYRQMFEEQQDNFDAVIISTPDHMHFPIALLAMQRGKHVYVEKPMTHTIGEARYLKAVAAETGVVTVMGNQGHANEGTRLFREWVEAGVIGTVREVHCWTDRPIWPQGVPLPQEPQEIPPTMDWNLWLGVAPQMPYNRDIAPGRWRGYWEYGCGAIGDMGCHMLDAAFWTLNLRGPVRVSAEFEKTPEHAVRMSKGAKITWEYPARGDLPPVKIVWYEGTVRPESIRDWPENVALPRNGVAAYGDEGVIMSDGTTMAAPRLLPPSRMAQFRERPPRTLPRAAGNNPYSEWIEAIHGSAVKPGSNFIDHAADLTEMTLLGNLALRTGKTIDWDPIAGQCKGMPELNSFINKSYRDF